MKQPLWKFSLCILFLLSTLSCITPQICTENGAYEAGKSAALDGRRLDFIGGSVCKDDDDKITFKSNFEKGYIAGKDNLCSNESAYTEGHNFGKWGRSSPAFPNRFNICDQKGDLELQFQNGYKSGLSLFCAPSSVEQKGREDGNTGSIFTFKDSTYLACGADKISALKNSYKNGYESGQKEYCYSNSIAKESFDAGISHNKAPSVDKYHVCKADRQKIIKEIITDSYFDGLNQYCQPEKHLEMIKRNAKVSETPIYDQSRYELCQQYLPKLWNEYRRLYQNKRSEVEQTRCIYNQGYNDGLASARRETNLRLEMPNYCSTKYFNQYKKGFLEGWQISKIKEVCLIEKAYDQGHQRGKSFDSMNINIPSLCPQQFHHLFVKEYELGFRKAKQDREIKEWRYHSDGKAYCYVNGRLNSYRDECSKLPKPLKPRSDIEWRYEDGRFHCYTRGVRQRSEHECRNIVKPEVPSQVIIEWRYDGNGNLSCYINGIRKHERFCYRIAKPRQKPHSNIEWRYHDDGYAHCYINNKIAKSTECSSIPRPRKR